MKHCPVIRVYANFCIAVAIVLAAAPAQAQFNPRPVGDPATGEVYHVEGSAAFWFPSPNITASRENFGVPGTVIDFVADLGVTRQSLPDLRLVLRPSGRHKFRLQFIPIKYESHATLRRDIVFNGIRYPSGLTVESALDWKSLRLAYEFDFVSRDRGFAGFVVEARYTDLRIDLISPNASEFSRWQAPIPAIGGIGRVYVVPNISITGEFTIFRLPENLIRDAYANSVDFDLYGTVNFTNNVGAQVGYRSLELGYSGSDNIGDGDMTLKGMYFGIVARY